MPLTALIIVGDADAPVLGICLTEFQIRRAVAAGAVHVVVLVERISAALLAATGRLRADGIGVDIARTIGDAVDFVHPDDRVLLIAIRVFVSGDVLATLAGGQGRAVLAQGSDKASLRWELIDAARRWTGWAAFAGTDLRQVAAMIGDWDLAPTILRFLLQHDARIDLVDAGAVMAIDQAADRDKLGALMIDQARRAPRGVGEAVSMALAVPTAARYAARAGLGSAWVERVALAIGALAIILGLLGFTAVALLAGVATLLAAQSADLLNRAVDPGVKAHRIFSGVMAGMVGVLLLLAGVAEARLTGQWGAAVLAIDALAALMLLRTLPETPARASYLADAVSCLALLAIGFAFGAPLLALILAVAHGFASIAWWRWMQATRREA